MEEHDWCIVFLDTRGPSSSGEEWMLHRYPYASSAATRLTEEMHELLSSSLHAMRLLTGESPTVITTFSKALDRIVKSGLIDKVDSAGVIVAAIYFGRDAAAVSDATVMRCVRRVVERLVARFGVVEMRLKSWAPEGPQRILLDSDIEGVIASISNATRAAGSSSDAPHVAPSPFASSARRGLSSGSTRAPATTQQVGSKSGVAFALNETTYGVAVPAVRSTLTAAIVGDDRDSVDAGDELMALLDEQISTLEIPGANGQQTSTEYIPFGACLLMGGDATIVHRTVCAWDARDIRQQCLRLGLCHASSQVAAPRIERMVLHLPLNAAGQRCSAADEACTQTKRVVLLIASNGEATLCQLFLGVHMNGDHAPSSATVLADGAVIVQHNCVRKCLQQMWDDALLLAVRERIVDRLYAHARRCAFVTAEGGNASSAMGQRQFSGHFEHAWNPRTMEVVQLPLPIALLAPIAVDLAPSARSSKAASAATVAHNTLTTLSPERGKLLHALQHVIRRVRRRLAVADAASAARAAATPAAPTRRSKQTSRLASIRSLIALQPSGGSGSGGARAEVNASDGASTSGRVMLERDACGVQAWRAAHASAMLVLAHTIALDRQSLADGEAEDDEREFDEHAAWNGAIAACARGEADAESKADAAGIFVPEDYRAEWALPALYSECELCGLGQGVGRAFGVGRSTRSDDDSRPLLVAHRLQGDVSQHWVASTISSTSRPRLERVWLAEHLDYEKYS